MIIFYIVPILFPKNYSKLSTYLLITTHKIKKKWNIYLKI